MADDVRVARFARRRTRRRRRLLAAAAAAVVLAAGGTAAVAATAGGGPGLRVVTIGRASITQLVETSGTVTSSAKVTPTFSVSGTVESVAVEIGQRVHQGQVLARLNTADLQASVDSAQSTLASARQRLAADKSGQTSNLSSASGGTGTTAATSGVGTNAASYRALTTGSTPSPTPTQPGGSTGGSGSGSSGSGSSGSGSGGSTSLSGLVQEITGAQNALLAAQVAVDQQQPVVDEAQQTVDADIVQNTQFRNAQKTACAASTDGSTGPDTAACASARADYDSFADTLASDGATLGQAIKAQDANIHRLDAAVAALDKLLRQLAAAASTAGNGGSGTPTGGSGTPTTGSGSTSLPTGSTGSGTTSPSGSTTQTASAAQLAADQAKIDAAKAALREAEQSRAAATLRSPISGRVASIGLSPGTSSSGGSITVIGTGLQTVTTSIPFAQINLVKLGQQVSVSIDGQRTPAHGTVSKIGLLSSTSSGTTTFPVTVQLASTSAKAYDGAGADVRITTGTAHDVVAVPNSALHAGRAGSYTVSVLRDGKTATVQVGLGVAGTALTQVTSGLKLGDHVVLADFSQSVPASTNTTGGTGGFARLLTGGGSFPVFPGGR